MVKNTKLLSGLKALAVSTTVLALASTSMVSAHGWHEPKAHGEVNYSAYGLQRSAHFNVEQESRKCAPLLNGIYTFDFEYLGGHYVHDTTVANQSATASYDISGGYPAGGPFSYAWNGTGSVVGGSVTNSVDYTVGAPGTHMDMNGTVASNGTMSGTWSDNYGGGSRTGTWTTASGAATSILGCRGDGSFHYSDVNGDWYKVKDIKYAKISGDDAWFAGVVTKASQSAWVGNWVFVKVHDGGPPATVGDLVWGSFTDENTAKLGVATMSNPGDGPFAITSGNLKVH